MEQYQLTATARLSLLSGDLTEWTGDAIVNAANEAMLGGGGVDGAIHQSAGPGLLAACRQVPEIRPGIRCPTGEARITTAGDGDLRVPYVIHAVGPVYQDAQTSAPRLAATYASALQLANRETLSRIATRVRRPGTSLDQMQVAIYRNNPQAFSEDQLDEIESLIDKLEDDEDVQAVYTNVA